MAWSISNSAATVEAGTVETLAGLASAPASGTPIESFASSDHVTHILTGARQLRIAGTLVIDQRVETLVCQATALAVPGVVILNGGILTLGRAVVSPSSALDAPGTSYGFGTALVIGKDGPHCCSNGALRVDSGGTLNIFSATLKTRGCIELPNGCNLNVLNGSIVNSTPTGNPGVTRIRLSEGAGINVDGITTYNIQLDWLDDEVLTKFERYASRDIPTGAQVALGANGAVRTFRSVPDYRDTSRCFCNIYQGRKDLRIINAEIGSANLVMSVQSLQNTAGFLRTTITDTVGGSTASVINVSTIGDIAVGNRIRIGEGPTGALRTVTAINGNAVTIDRPLDSAPAPGVAVSNVTSLGGRIFHELRFDVSDAAGVAVQDAQVYIRDTDNGQRIATDSSTISEIADRVYTAATDVAGRTPLITVLTAMWYRQDSVGGIPSPNGNEIVDVRGKTGVAGEDLFDAQIYSYGHVPVTVSNIRLNGLGPVTVPWTLFADSSITETDKSVVDAYAEVNSSQRLYDRAKAYLTDNFAGDSTPIVTRDGVVADCGSHDVTLANSGPAFAFSAGSGITINAGAVFTGSIRTTGTITVGIGVRVTGFTQDASGIDITIIGYTPGHRAVAAAWPAGQGVLNRANIVTAANYVTRTDAAITAATGALASPTTEFRNYTVGNMLILSGFANQQNNGSFTIATIAPDGRSCTLTRPSGAFEDEAAGSTVDIEDGSTGLLKLRLAANSHYYFVADAVSYLRSSALLIDTGVLQVVQGSLRRITDILGNNLIPLASELTDDEESQIALIDYDHAADHISFGADNATNEYSFRAVARAIEIGQSGPAAMANPYICTIAQGSFTFEADSGRTIGRAPGIPANLVPDLSRFQFTKTGADDQKDFVNFQNGAILVNSGSPAIVSLTGVAEGDFHRYLDGYSSKDDWKAQELNQANFDALMLAVPDATKDGYKGAAGPGGGNAPTVQQIVAAIQAADFEEGGGTRTLVQMLALLKGSIDGVPSAVLDVEVLPGVSVRRAIQTGTAILAGSAVVNGNNTTFSDPGAAGSARARATLGDTDGERTGTLL